MNLSDISTQLLFTTVPIWTERSDGSKGAATAFIYSYPVPDKPDQSVPVLVTNHHVVAGVRRALIELVLRDGDMPNRANRVRVELDPSTFASDTANDLAICPLGAVLHQLESSGRAAFFRTINPDLVPSASAINELAAIEDVTFIGYPSGLRDEANASPLIRRGITATPVWNEFQGTPRFLIDAGVFPGSSGSPVFILNQGAYTTKDGLSIGNRLLFLGVICTAMVRSESGREAFLGLGEVLKASVVQSFVERTVRQSLSLQAA